jgi:hypothetical protein
LKSYKSYNSSAAFYTWIEDINPENH